MICLLLFTLLGTEKVFIKGAEIYVPLRKGQAAAASDGTIFLLDQDESRVLRYTGDGAFLGAFGQAGEGPGDLNNPRGLQVAGGKLYVKCRGFISVWTVEGQFEQMLKPFTGMGGRLFKAESGFLMTEYSFMSTEPLSVFHLSDNLEDRKELFKYENPSKDQPKPGGNKMKYNPAPASVGIHFGHGGRVIFKREKEGYHIRIMDGQTGVELTAIKKKITPIAFDKAWGDRQLAEMASNMKKMPYGGKMEYVADYPSHFPAIQTSGVMPDGLLAVWRYNSPDGKPIPPDFYDEKGAPAKSELSGLDDIHRVLFIHDGLFYIGTYEDDEVGMAGVKPADAAKFIKDNPIDFDRMEHVLNKLKSMR